MGSRVYRSGGYPCGVGTCTEVLATAGALGGHRAQHKLRDAITACTGCGGGFGHPSDRTDTADGGTLCRTCADADAEARGEVTPW